MNNERHMIFVDGSNLLVQLSKELQIPFRADKPPEAALALASRLVRPAAAWVGGPITIRTYWFASYVGNEETLAMYATALRQHGLEPRLFRRRGNREKGVDIALTMDMLVNAFNDNFDLGILIAGDEDYVDLVHEVKRYGPRIDGTFFDKGLSPHLKLACDTFRELRLPNEETAWLAAVQRLSEQRSIS